MAGQSKTRRNPDTGRIERIPEAEQGALRAAAEGIAPPPPAARPGAITQRDMDFQAENGGQEPPPLPQQGPPVQPPPLPPQAPPVQPPPLPPAEEGSSGLGEAVQGARTGGRFGGVPGAVAGAAVGFVAGKKQRPQVIGTPEGAVTGSGDDTLRELLEVQKQIARTGSPIKGAITTNPINSKM